MVKLLMLTSVIIAFVATKVNWIGYELQTLPKFLMPTFCTIRQLTS